MKSWFRPQIMVKTKKKVFTELKADFARNWLTQDISLSKNDV